MPRIKTKKAKRMPKGWHIIEETLTELTQKMKDGKYFTSNNSHLYL